MISPFGPLRTDWAKKGMNQPPCGGFLGQDEGFERVHLSAMPERSPFGVNEWQSILLRLSGNHPRSATLVVYSLSGHWVSTTEKCEKLEIFKVGRG